MQMVFPPVTSVFRVREGYKIRQVARLNLSRRKLSESQDFFEHAKYAWTLTKNKSEEREK
jgi:hypothetical protein